MLYLWVCFCRTEANELLCLHKAFEAGLSVNEQQQQKCSDQDTQVLSIVLLKLFCSPNCLDFLCLGQYKINYNIFRDLSRRPLMNVFLSHCDHRKNPEQ